MATIEFYRKFNGYSSGYCPNKIKQENLKMIARKLSIISMFSLVLIGYAFAEEFTIVGKVANIDVRSVTYAWPWNDNRTIVWLKENSTGHVHPIGINKEDANRMLATILNAQNNGGDVTMYVTGPNDWGTAYMVTTN